MRLRVIFFFSSLIIYTGPGFGDAQKQDPGKIEAVTVYSDRALVSRTMKVTTAKDGYVVFTDLPAQIIRDSLRARVQGASITGVSLVPVIEKAEERFKDHPLKKKIDQLNDKIDTENDQLSTFLDQLKLLESFGRLTTQKSDQQSSSGSINTNEWSKAMSFIESRRTGYLEKIRSSKKVIADLRDERREVQKKFHQVTSAHKTAPFNAMVSYASKTKPQILIELNYMVSSVSWKGFYDLRGSSEKNSFEFLAHAAIRQNSGENWQNARISLSSARPSTSTSPGILQPWRVSASSMGKPRAKRNGGKGRGFGSDGDTSTATADSSETSTFSIQLPARETIKSNNVAHEIVLKKSTLEGRVDHVAVPHLSSSVFLRANLKNTSGMPIFLGDINIFLDQNFVGKSNLENRVAAGESFDLFLGPDQRMRISRKLVKGEVVGSGVFSKRVEVVNKWQVEVGNYTGKTRNLVIYDRYPIAADPDITTKFIASSSKVQKDENGILQWNFKLAPQKKEKFSFSYSMSFLPETWKQIVEREERVRPVRQNDNFMQPKKKQLKRQYNLEQMF